MSLALIQGVPRFLQGQQQSEYLLLGGVQLGRVVPTSGFPAPTQPQQRALRTPPSLRLPRPLWAFSALPAACHAPTQAPFLAAESRAGKVWLTSQAVKVRKLETEINPQSCSVVKVAASRPRQPPNPLGPLPPSCHWHPINTHM